VQGVSAHELFGTNLRHVSAIFWSIVVPIAQTVRAEIGLLHPSLALWDPIAKPRCPAVMLML